MNRIKVFSTCPQSKEFTRENYFDHMLSVARWSDAIGCEGILIYSDNSIIDPWSIAQEVIQHTIRLVPLVAVQPIYMHPYTVAKKVTSLGFLYGRRVALNMIAGGFRQDLLAMGDSTEHDDRYLRMLEYCAIINGLLAGEKVTHNGRYYRVRDLHISPALPTELRPEMLMSGSSDAGRDTAASLGATAIEYPEPPSTIEPRRPDGKWGIRVGLIAREKSEEAWRAAWERFPEDRRGRIMHGMAMAVSDSEWHHRLSQLSKEKQQLEAYWLWPFQNYHTFCPYLVGNFPTVATLLANYIARGYTHYILDIPREQGDLDSAKHVFSLAGEMVTRDLSGASVP
jgi:alkanesulfonate monooxygenase